MKTGSKGVAIIQKWEGYHKALPNGDCMAYLDTVAVPPVWTAGFGCTEGVYKGLIWTRKQAEAKLMEEIAQTEREVAELVQVQHLNQNQYDAVISIAYNLRGGIRKAPTLVKHLNNQDWQKASDAFLLYCKAGGKTIKGLLNRRKDEKALFDTWTKKEIKEESKTVRTLDRFWKWLTALFTAFAGADALEVGKSYIDWVKEFSSNNKYLVMAGIAGVAYAIYKYVIAKRVQEHEEGRYTPSE